MILLNRSLLWFSRYLWFSVAIFVVFVLTFALYGRAEQRIKQANDARLWSLQLSDELRDTSEALTIKARTPASRATVSSTSRFWTSAMVGARVRARHMKTIGS